MDEKIMKMGISKTSSDKYLHLVKFDLDRFQRILGPVGVIAGPIIVVIINSIYRIKKKWDNKL